MAWVVRAGIATTERLSEGYGQHRAMPGIYGFSVQYEPGKTIEELAQAGHFRNKQISCADELDLQACLRPLGYSMRLIVSPGGGYHRTLTVLYDAAGQMLDELPQDAAEALSRIFQQRPNPHRYGGP